MKKIISGIRPTGNIHLGNYTSVIKNWIKLQNNYKCFFFIADIHAMTTYKKKDINLNTKLILQDLISYGININKCYIYIQSHILEIFELYSILSMITSISIINRIPSIKQNNNNNYGFLGYPVLQTADIMSINCNFIPIGIDQIPHIEISKKIIKKINFFFKYNFFNIPNYIISKNSKIIGINGQKMSKSLNNTISLSDSIYTIKYKIKNMKTYKNKIYKKDYGKYLNCSIYEYHKIYNYKIKNIKKYCEMSFIKCYDCKQILFNNIIIYHNNKIKKIKFYDKNTYYYNRLLNKNTKKIRKIVKYNLEEIKKKMKLLI